MQKLTAIGRNIVYLFIAFLFIACDISSKLQVESDYDKLCQIFDSLDQNENSQAKNINFLTEKIKNNVPNIYVLYQNAALVDQKDKYQFFKESAQKTTKKQWDCVAMQLYYKK